MKKLKPIKTLKRKLKKALCDAVRERDKWTCVWCGKKAKNPQDAQPHHIVPQSISNAYGKFELLNVVMLCFNCHLHRIPNYVDDYIAFRDAYLAERGFTYEKFRDLYRTPVHLKADDYLYLLEKLEKAL